MAYTSAGRYHNNNKNSNMENPANASGIRCNFRQRFMAYFDGFSILHKFKLRRQWKWETASPMEWIFDNLSMVLAIPKIDFRSR